ncbi:hypothetical protein Tco_1187073 [Tanacetum coccineum]
MMLLLDRLEFEKCNMRLKTDIKPKEATFQVVLNALALTPFYHAFLITADVPAIYMQEVWATFCPKIPGQKFEDLLREHDILSFIRDLGHTGDITYLTDVNVDYLHQPWRAFATIINKCLSGKEPGMDKIHILRFCLWRESSKTKVPDPDTSPKQKPVQATKVAQVMELTLSQRFLMSKHLKMTSVDEGTGTIPGVPDVPIYESKSEKESWGDSEDEDNENNSDDIRDEGNDNNDGDDDDANDDDKQEEFYEEKEENIDDEETMYDDEDDEVTKELYEDVNVNLGNEDTEMTNADQGATDQQNVSQQSGFEQVEEDAHVTITPVHDTQKADEPVQSSSVSFDFTSKLLNLENPSPADNEIASLMETSARYATAVPENTSATTLFPSLPNFASVFKFNERVFNLEKDVLEIKQVDQYAQALSSIPAIVDHYMDNKLREAINKAILTHNLDCRQEAQDEKNAYIELIDTSLRALIKEEVNTQLPQILPQAVSDFANPVIEKNVIESVEAAVLTRSSSQPTSTYEAAASLSEFELTKILIDKIEKNKSFDKVEYKKKLYDALVESYNTNKYLFDSYGEVFLLKRSRDEKDKDRDPSTGSDRGTKRRKSSKDSSGKSAHAEKPSHTVEDSGMQQDQEYVTGDNDEQPSDKEVTKAYWFKKPERPPTHHFDWNLEYLNGRDLSRQYSTSVTKTKAATYDLNWIKDLAPNLWSPVQKLTNLTIDERYSLNVALCMFTRRIVIQRRVEDLQLGVESYQKKVNLTKPDTFSDGTLDDVLSALNDIAKGIRMEYLPMRNWSNLDKKRARVMVQDIDKQLYQRRLMRNLEKFVGGREYMNDLRLLERTI